MRYKLVVVVGVYLTFVVGIAAAADIEKSTVAVETVYTGLDSPCGLAVQPSTGSVFVSEIGAGQVVRFLPMELDKPVVAITGLPHGDSPQSPLNRAGPMGLAFLHQNLIVVGGGDLTDGKDAIHVFELPSDPASAKPLKLGDAKQSLEPIAAGKESSTGEGSFWGLAMSPSTLWITSQGDRGKGWILKADVVGNSLENFKPAIPTKLALPVDNPMGIAVRNSRDFVVVGQVGKLDASRDSVLAFYHTRNGALMMTLPTQLYDVVGLAYSPKSNRLYAVDLAWGLPKEGALYRLDSTMIDGRAGVKAVKLASLDRPTALAFAADNTLYVTAMGNDAGDEKSVENTSRGVLVKVTGDL
jgi:hypothetical protein